MSRASESREILIAELLGDFVKVLDRIDTVMPELDAICKRLERVSMGLPEFVRPLVTSIAQAAIDQKNAAVAHITHHANESARTTIHEQTGAMKASARTIFADEVTPTLRSLAQELQQVVQRRHRWWDDWLVYLSLVISSAALTACVMSVWPLWANAVDTKASPTVQSPVGVEPAPASAAAPQAEPPPKPERVHVRK